MTDARPASRRSALRFPRTRLVASAAAAGLLLAGCTEPAARTGQLTVTPTEISPAGAAPTGVWLGAGDAAGRGLARGTMARIVADSD